jgi:hypothetical protein
MSYILKEAIKIEKQIDAKLSRKKDPLLLQRLLYGLWMITIKLNL